MRGQTERGKEHAALVGKQVRIHAGVELRANLKSISHRFHLFEVAFVWEMTKETIHLPMGCLQGSYGEGHLEVGAERICRHLIHYSRKDTMGRELMVPRTDRMTRIQSGVASPVTTNHPASGSVFVNLRKADNFENWV